MKHQLRDIFSISGVGVKDLLILKLCGLKCQEDHAQSATMLFIRRNPASCKHTYQYQSYPLSDYQSRI